MFGWRASGLFACGGAALLLLAGASASLMETEALPPLPKARPERSELLASGDFVGAERCKLCHRSIYESWLLTPHARAFERVEQQQCLSCHRTGNQDGPAVQCEACHGAGGDYWPAEVMIDPDKARMAGLVHPDEARCRSCHDNQQPGHRREFAMPASPSEQRRWVH